MTDQLGKNKMDALIDKFTAQGMTRAQARIRARNATQPRLTPPPGVKQQREPV